MASYRAAENHLSTVRVRVSPPDLSLLTRGSSALLHTVSSRHSSQEGSPKRCSGVTGRDSRSAPASRPSVLKTKAGQRPWSAASEPGCSSRCHLVSADVGGGDALTCSGHGQAGWEKNHLQCCFGPRHPKLTTQKSPSLTAQSLRVGCTGEGARLGKTALPPHAAKTFTCLSSPSPPKIQNPRSFRTALASGSVMPTNQSSTLGSKRLGAPSKADAPTAAITAVSKVPFTRQRARHGDPAPDPTDWASEANHVPQSPPASENRTTAGEAAALSLVDCPRSCRGPDEQVFLGEEPMDTSCAFSLDNTPQSTAKTISPTLQQTAHNSYALADRHLPSASQSTCASTESLSVPAPAKQSSRPIMVPGFLTTGSSQPITVPSFLMTGSSPCTPPTTTRTNGHFLPRPCPPAPEEPCSLGPELRPPAPEEPCSLAPELGPPAPEEPCSLGPELRPPAPEEPCSLGPELGRPAPEEPCSLGPELRPPAPEEPCSLGPELSCANDSAAEERTQEPASGPTGLSVGSVVHQISAIQLTKPALPTSSSPPRSPAMEGLEGEAEFSSQECVAMQVDCEEEDVPDEMEQGGSDDETSDCSSITCASSTAYNVLLSRVESMCSGGGVGEEERSALVPSLFPFFPPTLYFSIPNERVELLPQAQRRLLRWKMSTVTPNVVRHTIARSHFRVSKRSHDWLGCWGHHMKSPLFKALREHQKLNHFPGSFQIGRKDRLWRNLSKMRARFGKQEFSFFPRSFILPQDMKMLRRAWEDSGSRQKWIIKPPASARGVGIQVIHKWSQMPKKRPLLVQKYLHKPYLISGNKFDLRIYVYVTSYDPLRIYIFSDGLVRFASCKYSYSMRSLGNKFMHLTNYSVNKKNSEYQSNSDDKACQGHKWALKALWQYLGAKGVNTTLIWDQIKDIVIKTIIASDPYINNLLKMHVRAPYSCHELFGFDIMLDENLKPWVLEVNISPSLHSNTALDLAIKGQMIRDLLNLAGFLLPQREEVMAASGSSSSSSTSSLCGGSRDRSRADLSNDEKVKRAFYLSQPLPEQEAYSGVLDVLTPEDVRVLAQSEDELSRRGEFERVFPAPSCGRYLRFFECRRYLNILLSQWEQRHWSERSAGISLLRTLCQKGVHLGTSDPAHMWSKCTSVSRFEARRADFSSSSVAVSWQRRIHSEDDDDDDDEDDIMDREVQSISSSMPNINLPASLRPGSTPTPTPSPIPSPGLDAQP